MTAITNLQDVCTSCEAFVAPATEAAALAPDQPETVPQPATNPFQHASQGAPMPAYPSMQNAQFVPQTDFQNTPPPRFEERGGATTSAHVQPLDANCVRCRAAVPRGQQICFDCNQPKKSSPFKYIVALLLIGVIGFFSFDYAYEQLSPYGTLRKYAKTTGADDSLVYSNVVLKGETNVSVNSANAPLWDAKLPSRDPMGTFTFKMIHKKPNVSSVEMMREDETVFKQVFDGTSGWKYTNMPGQPAGYEDTDEGFASEQTGLGMDNYDSLEFMNPASMQEFGQDVVELLNKTKEVEAANLKQPTVDKTFIVAKSKRRGKTESTLLVFDQQTGLMLAMARNSMINNMVATNAIFFDNYAKFPVKRKGLFGTSETRVLVPTKMRMVMGVNNLWRAAGMPVVIIDMNIKTVETDAEIDPEYFTR